MIFKIGLTFVIGNKTITKYTTLASFKFCVLTKIILVFLFISFSFFKFCESFVVLHAYL